MMHSVVIIQLLVIFIFTKYIGLFMQYVHNIVIVSNRFHKAIG